MGDEKSGKRNHVLYGSAPNAREVIEMLAYEAELPAWIAKTAEARRVSVKGVVPVTFLDHEVRNNRVTDSDNLSGCSGETRIEDPYMTISAARIEEGR